ncbi:MAG: hypothetical protein JXR51_01925 [Bacteroidales bacterium]|nr:hypothetical protein [Bacteroidales bacterium]
MLLNRKKYLLLFLVIITIYLIACTPQKSYKVLSFIFDGVPEVSNENTVLTKNTSKLVDFNSDLNLSTKATEPQFVFHSPYQKRNCESCHDQRKMG